MYCRTSTVSIRNLQLKLTSILAEPTRRHIASHKTANLEKNLTTTAVCRQARVQPVSNPNPHLRLGECTVDPPRESGKWDIGRDLLSEHHRSIHPQFARDMNMKVAYPIASFNNNSRPRYRIIEGKHETGSSLRYPGPAASNLAM